MRIAPVDRLVLRDLLTRYSVPQIRAALSDLRDVCPACHGRTYTGPLETAARCTRCGGKGSIRP